jgi:hypothetical protein
VKDRTRLGNFNLLPEVKFFSNYFLHEITKLECVHMPGSEGVVGEKGRSQRKGGEMTQTLYAHMNKRNKKIK